MQRLVDDICSNRLIIFLTFLTVNCDGLDLCFTVLLALVPQDERLVDFNCFSGMFEWCLMSDRKVQVSDT